MSSPRWIAESQRLTETWAMEINFRCAIARIRRSSRAAVRAASLCLVAAESMLTLSADARTHHGMDVARPSYMNTSRATKAVDADPGSASFGLEVIAWYPTDATSGAPKADAPIARAEPYPLDISNDETFGSAENPSLIGSAELLLESVTSYFQSYGAQTPDSRVLTHAMIASAEPPFAALSFEQGFEGTGHDVARPVGLLMARAPTATSDR